MATLEQLRQVFGGDSDEATLQAASKRLNLPISVIAEDVGFDMGGKWGNRARASVDRAQSQLYGVGEALGLGDWTRRGREGNAVQADVRSRMAQDQGAITSYKQVGGLGDAAEYVGGLALDTAPQLGAMGLAAAAAGPVGAGAVGYGFALGDVLENQREQAGRTDLLSAAALAVPYAAVDTLTGVGGKVATRSLGRSGIKALDNMTGVRGVAARTGASIGRTALTEGAGETFQEGMNQLGRMAVDPRAELFSDDALERYGESFVGGAALGGAFGAVGGHRRSEGWKPEPTVTPDGKVDMLGGSPPAPPPLDALPAPTLGQGELFSSPAPLDNSDPAVQLLPLPELLDTRATIQGQLGELQRRYDALAAQPDSPARREQMSRLYGMLGQLSPQLDWVQTQIDGHQRGEAAAADAGAGQGQLDFGPALGLRGSQALAQARGLSVPAVASPDTIQQNLGLFDPGTQEAETRRVNARRRDVEAALSEPSGQAVPDFARGQQELRLDAGQYSDIASGTQAAQREQQIRAEADRVAEEVAAARKRAEDRGINVKRETALDAFMELERLRREGTITDGQFAENLGLLQEKASKVGSVKRFLAGIQETKAAVAASDAAPVRPLAGINPSKTVEVGRAGRKASVTPDQLLAKINAATPLDKMRILAVTGMDVTEDPTTGRPKLVQSGNPLTFDEVAAEEARRTGKKVTRQAIQQALAKFGITEEVATQMSASTPSQVTAEELGIDPTDPASSGYRVEDRASKATGTGLVNTAEDTQLSKVQQAQVQRAVAAVREAGGTAEAIDAATKGLGKAAKARALELLAKDLEAAAPASTPASDAPKIPAGAKNVEVTDLRERNAATVRENVRRMLDSVEAGYAELAWNETRLNWADLPDTLKADWVAAFVDNLRQNGGELDFQELDREQERTERQFADYQGQQEAPRPRQVDAGGGGGVRLVAPAEGSGPAIPAEGSGGGEAAQRAPAPKPVVVTKAARQGLPDGATQEQQASYKRQLTKVRKYEQLVACLTKAG